MDNMSYNARKVSPFEEKLDEEIVIEAKKGDVSAQEYLINKYGNFVKSKSKSYFLIGADKEDICWAVTHVHHCSFGFS